MTEARQMQEDLQYVRHVVSERERQRPPGTTAIYWVWAAYTLVGYTLIDVAPHASGLFFLIGGIVAGMISGVIGYRAQSRSGEWDPQGRWRAGMHWGAGVLLCIAATFALAAVIPPLREKTYSGQLVVVMIGIVYFLAGVHMDRFFLWLGPVLIAGGVVVGLVPHFGWTALGVVIAAGLTLPTLLGQRKGVTTAATPTPPAAAA